MPNLLSLLRRPPDTARMSWGDWLTQLAGQYPAGYGGLAGQKREDIENNFCGYVQGAYKSNGVVFACSMARMLVFAELRFQWQAIRAGRPGKLFGTDTLRILERPWPNGTTGDLASRAIQDADFAGNFFAARDVDRFGVERLRRLRPDWVSLMLTAPPDEAVESDVVGIMYRPGGVDNYKNEGHFYPIGEFVHWAPIPDPEAQFRGMSWLSPVLREVQADKAATLHKLKFFENAATPNIAVSLKESVTPDQFKEFVAAFKDRHRGVDTAYETLFLGGGADVTVIGKDLQQLDFKATQGAGETRVAMAAGVHPVIVGMSEGMQGASLNAGNYVAIRRRFADGTIRPLWRSFAAAMEAVVPPPNSSTRLWYDARDVPFLREDAEVSAEIVGRKAASMRQLIDAGYKPDSVTAAVDTEDLSLLEHSGIPTVQVQPATTTPAPTEGSQDDGSD